MNIFYIILLIYLIAINIIAMAVTIYDKFCAVHNRWRVKESTLLLLSALGGSVGMYVTMHIIRHKTKHIKFMLGIPVILISELLIIFLVWRFVNG